MTVHVDSGPNVVDIVIQEAADEGRHWRVFMGDHIEVKVFSRLNGILPWKPLLEGSQVVIRADRWIPSGQVRHEANLLDSWEIKQIDS